MTSTMSSIEILPTIFPFASITGSVTRSYFRNIAATSSWSTSAVMLFGSGSMILYTRRPGGWRTSACRGSDPTSMPWSSTT
jgi:hypothetical protein